MNRFLYSICSLALLLSLFTFTGFPLHGSSSNHLDQLIEEPPEFYIEGKTICEGEALQVPIRVRFFENITSMQYTIRWDIEVLKFDSVSHIDSNFPDLLFGMNEAGNGYITASWVDPALSGITLDDEAPLLMLNFTAVGDNGTTSKVLFSDNPAPFEISQNADLIDGITHDDSVMIREPVLMNAVVEDEVGEMGNGQVDITIDNGTPPYSYSWSNGADSEDLPAVSAGSYSCTIADANNCGLMVGPYEVGNLVSANDIASLRDISVFPNPTVDRLDIQAAFSQQENLTIRLYDLLGQLQYEETLQSNAFSRQIKVTDLPRGTYFLELSTAEGRFVEKVVLQKD